MNRLVGALILIASLAPAMANADTAAVLEPPDAESGPRSQLLPIPVASLATAEDEVRRTVGAARAQMVTVLAQGDPVSDTKLAESYGELGAMYHAHSVYIPAVACYRNAEILQPDDFRWPYYLGYLYQQTSQPMKAAQAFERALAIRPDDPFAQLRLAQIHLSLNRPEPAEPLLMKVVDIEAVRGSALVALGGVATAQRDHRVAANYFEQALKENPQANRIHYPLAMAYRALGDLDQAKTHLERYGDIDPVIQDPLVAELDDLLTGTRTHFYRGIEAIRNQEYEESVESFSAGLKREPDNVNARVSLARALYLSGQPDKAFVELQQALAKGPRHDLANFLLALYHDEAGRFEEAETHYRATLDIDPKHAGAHLYLANLLMRAGSCEEAATHYAETLKQVPSHSLAGFLEVLALARSGADHALLRDKLERVLTSGSGEDGAALLLVKLLAASPDDGVRDGERALRIAQTLYDRQQHLDQAEALAMAYAEQGQFEQAVSLQENALAVSSKMGRFDRVPVLFANLEKYQDEQAIRTPWQEHDPLFYLAPTDAFVPYRDYPALYAY